MGGPIGTTQPLILGLAASEIGVDVNCIKARAARHRRLVREQVPLCAGTPVKAHREQAAVHGHTTTNATTLR